MHGRHPFERQPSHPPHKSARGEGHPDKNIGSLTPSGPVLTLLTQLAEEGDLRGFSHAFVTFARAKPMNAHFVAEATPAKILNAYLLKYLKLDVSGFLRWQTVNPDWAETIKAAIRTPEMLVSVVDAMVEGIRTQ
jgi:hypothetical protein